jgi:magnesium-transporting ATPase (P-type)
MGYTFVEKDDDNYMVVEVGKEVRKFRLLHTLEFSSERKRMSVIVEDGQGKILLLCKGADDIIVQRS